MIEVRLERASNGQACGECNLAHVSTFRFNGDVAGETLTLAPSICLTCLQAFGVSITQAARDRNRQPL